MTVKKYFFCFLLSYFFFHIFSFLFSFALEPLIYWSGNNLFDINYSFEKKGYGSGDTTYKYLETFWHFCLSVSIAFPIMYFIEKEKIMNTITYSFLVLLRIYLVFFMLIYGIGKILPIQFPPLSLLRLSQPYGESSPMGLAWSFMRYSPYYSAFSGLAEVIGGLLLLNRKTVTLGAFILVGVLSNVVMMNFSYDIPVKLSSTHMLMASIILLMNDRRRFIGFFILNKPIDSKRNQLHFENNSDKTAFRIISLSLKALLVVGVFFISGFQFISSINQPDKEPALYGVYEIMDSSNNSNKYFSFVFDKYDRACIRYDNNKEEMFVSEIDTIKRTIYLKSPDKKKQHKQLFTYTKTKKGIVLKSGDSIEINLNKKAKEDFLLVKRGFHWINEKPYNR